MIYLAACIVVLWFGIVVFSLAPRFFMWTALALFIGGMFFLTVAGAR